MILDEPTALRCAKLMKLQLPPTSTLTVLGEQSFKYAAYSGSGLREDTEVRWTQDGDTTAPYNVMIRRERADAPPRTEFYASWTGFTQAYHIKAGWKD